MTCFDTLFIISKHIDDANNLLIDKMSEPDMNYKLVCVKPDVTYDTYYENLKILIDTEMNKFIIEPNKCVNSLTTLATTLNSLQNVSNTIQNASNDLEIFLFDNVYSLFFDKKSKTMFEMSTNPVKTISDILTIMFENCKCQTLDIVQIVLDKYSEKYNIVLSIEEKKRIITIIKKNYVKIASGVKNNNIDPNVFISILNENLPNANVPIPSFSIKSELEKLIPDDLGSLKDFFIKIISTYYDNIHPIVWAQILKYMLDNILIDLPYSTDDWFKFVSKSLLLNSGPFILKILQLIRPALSPELASKYNLTKLVYPVLKVNQVRTILHKVVNEWDLYEIIYNKSASVGHVCIVKRADNPKNIFVIKIIKPIAIAQSCWEYKILHDLFKKGTCERTFVKRMLKSNGAELNVQNEIINIKTGYKLYTDTYSNVFGTKLNIKITTIQVLDKIIKDNCWFALAMSLAPGLPLSDLIESSELKIDSKYRAKLHRCLDLLVYKFFNNIVTNGFYHGDLHAGNIFYSYKNNQMTLIDFGAVGQINIFENTEDTNALIRIIVMSIFYDYDEIFDLMTNILNKKCLGVDKLAVRVGSTIDKFGVRVSPTTDKPLDINSIAYNEFKTKLKEHHITNIINYKKEELNETKYENKIFDTKRINAEMSAYKYSMMPPTNNTDESIYNLLELHDAPKETVIENKNTINDYSEIVGETTSITFSGIMESIIKFYALNGVNVAIKFSEFYELQKAYSLLLGVLTKTGYNSYRTGIAIRKALTSWKNLSVLTNVRVVGSTYSFYSEQKKKFKELSKQIEKIDNGQSNKILI